MSTIDEDLLLAEGAQPAPDVDSDTAEAAGATGAAPAAGVDAGTDDESAVAPLAVVLRPALAAAFATAAAGVAMGGTFGSWTARALGLLSAFFGAGMVVASRRSKRTTTWEVAFPLIALIVASLSLVPAGASPGELFALMGKAVQSGRALQPPVPFDPGWWPIVILLTSFIGFAAAWAAVALERPRLAVVVPLPAVFVTAITQPKDGQFLTGLGAFVLILAALAVLFRGDATEARDFGSQFELKRAIRSMVAAIPAIGLLVVLNNADFLFPDPQYDPSAQAQKPRAVPLSAASDRVLFEVAAPAGTTGPWRTGVLDVYDEKTWKLPPLERKRLEPVSGDGALDAERTDRPQHEVAITVHDLGDTSVLPGVAGTTHFTRTAGSADLVYDLRTGLVRVPSGRVPAGLEYTLRFPVYPSDSELVDARLPKADAFDEHLEIPAPPPTVRALLDQAPLTPWARLNFLRQHLLDTVTAKGAGTPVEISPARVEDILNGSKTGTPYEIVATEAMLARWAGVPSRIGFGFDGLNAEGDAHTVRPRNAAQWLEVNFEGFGWVPLIGTPKKAQADLTADPFARFDPATQASDDIVVEVYIPYEVRRVHELYESVRAFLVRWSPLIVLLVLAYVGWPVAAKARRRVKRRQWATEAGPRGLVAFEYAEFRDLATDLNVADIYATPLEYLYQVRPDEEHEEFAWLVSRVLYGDLATVATDADAVAAEQLGMSLRRRLLRAQPVPSRLLAYISKASLETPYVVELPNITHLPSVRRLRPPVPWRRHRHLRPTTRRSRHAGVRAGGHAPGRAR